MYPAIHTNDMLIKQAQVDLAFLRFRVSRGNWKTQAHTGRLFVDYAALSNNRCVPGQLGTLERKRKHFHVNWGQNAGTVPETKNAGTQYRPVAGFTPLNN